GDAVHLPVGAELGGAERGLAAVEGDLLPGHRRAGAHGDGDRRRAGEVHVEPGAPAVDHRPRLAGPLALADLAPAGAPGSAGVLVLIRAAEIDQEAAGVDLGAADLVEQRAVRVQLAALRRLGAILLARRGRRPGALASLRFLLATAGRAGGDGDGCERVDRTGVNDGRVAG